MAQIARVAVALVVASFLPFVEYNRRTDPLQHPGGVKMGLGGGKSCKGFGFGRVGAASA